MQSVGTTPSCIASSQPVALSRGYRRTPALPLRRCSCIAKCLSDRELEVKISIAGHTDRLDLSDCQLTQLDPSIFDLTSLRELSLAGNQLPDLPPAISRLTALEKLVLAGNQLHHLPEEIGQLQHLKGLWAHGNLLEDMPEALHDLTGLQCLSLAGKHLIPAVAVAPHKPYTTTH